MRVEALDRQAAEALWHAYKVNLGEEERAELIQTYQGYVRIMAARYYRQRVRDDIPFDEYLQFAQIGLIEAIDRFDPERGVLFETFAGKRIRGAIVDGIAHMSEVQQQLAERRRQVQDRAESLAEAAGAPDEGPAQLFAHLADIVVGLAIGFTMESDDGEEGAELAYGDVTYARVELRQLRERMLLAVRDLPERVRTVITRHYLHQQSFAEVAHELGLTPGRVSQLHRDGIERLRYGLKRQANLDIHC